MACGQRSTGGCRSRGRHPPKYRCAVGMTGIRPQIATNARNLIRWGCLHWLQLGSYSSHVNGTPDQCVLGSSTTRQPSVDVWSHADYEARSCVYTLLLNRGSGPVCMKLRKALPGFGGQFSYGISQLVLLVASPQLPPPGQSTTLLQQAFVQVSIARRGPQAVGVPMP
jgi:hypothetical protein